MMPYSLPEFKLSEPDQALLDFCGRYPQAETQQRLRHWFSLALRDSRAVSCRQNTELITFYEDLKTLVSAVYQLHDLPGQTGPGTPSLNAAPVPSEHVSLSGALEALHANVSANWILLVCPPE